MRRIGVDIGSYSIKVAQVEHHGNSVEIIDFREFPLSSKPGVDKELELITSLKEIVSAYQNQAEEPYFIFSLPQDKVNTRNLSFPFKEKFKILKSLPFELEDLIPLSLDEAIFDAKFLEKYSSGADILGVAAPKSLIKETLGLCSDIQVDPDILTLEGLALNNLFENIFAPIPTIENKEILEEENSNESEPEDKKAKLSIQEKIKFEDGEAILNIGHSSCLLVIRSNDSLKTVRHISWGTSNIIQAVANKYSILPQEALQKLKASKGILLKKSQGTQEDWDFSELISNEISSLGKSISLTLLNVKGAHQVKIRGIGLMGGFASIKGLGAKLTQFIKIPCNKILKIKNYPQLDTNSNKNQELSMGVALGLALEGCKKSSNPPVNFRKNEFEKKGTGFQSFWEDWGFYLQIGLASIVIFFIHAFVRNNIAEDLSYQARKNMRKAAARIFNIKEYNAKSSKLKKVLSDFKQRELIREKVLSYTKKSPSPLKALKNISGKASSRLDFPLDLKSLSINQELVVINGYTTNKKGLNLFKEKLKKLAKGPLLLEKEKTVTFKNKKSIEFSLQFKPKKRIF